MKKVFLTSLIDATIMNSICQDLSRQKVARKYVAGELDSRLMDGKHDTKYIVLGACRINPPQTNN